MWPLWLIVAIAVGSAVILTVTGVVVAVHVERKRQRKLMSQHHLNRNLSRYHRPHLSINDVDISGLPRPVRGSLRQSFQSSRRDSRFYTTMSSEEEIRCFPDETADSLADVPYIIPDTTLDHHSQWLASTKLKKQNPRRKKIIQLSTSAPLAQTRLSAVTEKSEPEISDSPALVELPAHTTPKVTPERVLPHSSHHAPPHPFDPESDTASHPISHGKMLKPHSISMASIQAYPPDCPLPPLPESSPGSFGHHTNMSGSQPSTQGLENSMLNSSLPSHQDQAQEPLTTGPGPLAAGQAYSAFDFGWHDASTQVVKVEADYDPDLPVKPTVGQSPHCSEYRAGLKEDRSLKTIDASSWAVPRNFNRFQRSTPTLSATSEAGSRPISAISLTTFSGAPSGMSSPNRSPGRMSADEPSCANSTNSTDLFRQSVIGTYLPSATQDSPRSKGHRRQNCVRISGLTPVDSARRRLSSQLDRLAEAEEIDTHDRRVSKVDTEAAVSSEVISPNGRAARVSENGATDLDIRDASKLHKHKPPFKTTRINTSSTGFTTLEKKPYSSTTESSHSTIAPWLHRSRTAGTGFRYQGSPSSDPTKSAPLKQEYSPASPNSKIITPEKKTNLADLSYSPVSPSMLNSANPSVANSPVLISAFSPRRHRTQLHGPRNIPPPSLRTRNKTSPRTRPTERSGSPIRKNSSTGSVKQSQRNTSQDDLRRSLALLRNLNHAAQCPSGLPEVNVINPNTNPTQPSPIPQPKPLNRTPSSHYTDSPSTATATHGPRHRSRHSTTRETPSMFDTPRIRPEYTHSPPFTHPSPQTPHQPQLHTSNPKSPFPPSTVPIWEDTSVNSTVDSSPPIPPYNPDRPAQQTYTTRPHNRRPSESRTLAAAAPPVQKDRLWKLQQNADIITTRALALGNGTQTQNIGGGSSRKSPRSWAAKRGEHGIGNGSESKFIDRDTIAVQTRFRSGSGSTTCVIGGVGGQRKRSHTVAANERPLGLENGKGMKTQMQTQMCKGVGLGVDFGRTGLRTMLVNEMERDGIGRLG